MQMMYNSPNYCVVAFPAQEDSFALAEGGYEIVAKNLKRGLFIHGPMAAHFQKNVQKLVKQQPGFDEMDAFLGQFDDWMTHPLVLH